MSSEEIAPPAEERKVAPEPGKLTWLQRGGLQTVATWSVAVVGGALLGGILYWLGAPRLQPAGINPFGVIAVTGVGSCLLHYAAKASTKLNLAQSVSLPKGVEFSSAMRKLGILELEDQLACIRKRKLPVFIAAEPLLEDEEENVRAKIYTYMHDPLTSKPFIERSAGKRVLCLDVSDYERIIPEIEKNGSLKDSVAFAKKENELAALKDALELLTVDKRRVETELAALKVESKEFKQQTQILPAQEKGRVQRLRVERVLWAMLEPAMERLKAQHRPGKIYTFADLEKAFSDEWTRRPDLQQRLMQLSGCKREEDLKNHGPSIAMWDAVKADFREAGMTSTGGRPKKTSEVSG